MGHRTRNFQCHILAAKSGSRKCRKSREHILYVYRNHVRWKRKHPQGTNTVQQKSMLVIRSRISRGLSSSSVSIYHTQMNSSSGSTQTAPTVSSQLISTSLNPPRQPRPRLRPLPQLPSIRPILLHQCPRLHPRPQTQSHYPPQALPPRSA